MSAEDKNTTKMLYTEQPLQGESEILDQTRRSLSRWMLDSAPKDRLAIAAIYGGRGSGKTSLLRRLRTLTPEEAATFVAPEDCEGLLVLDPAMAQDEDELVFDLLDLLDKVQCPEGAKQHLQEAREAAAHRAEGERFLDLAKELVPSKDRLPEALATQRLKLAQGDRRLRGAMKRWGQEISKPTGRRILLLIDDVDLAPKLSFTMLDLLRRFLCDVPAVVVICADEDTLLRAMRKELGKTNPGIPRLNHAYVQKFIEFSVRLWPWTPQDGLRVLKDGQEGVKSAWSAVFEGSPWAVMQEGLLMSSQRSLGGSPGRGQAQWALELDEFTDKLIGELIPRTPRLLKQLHNRWVTELLWAQTPLPSLSPDIAVPDQRTLLALTLAVDVAWPELELWSWVLAGGGLSNRLLPAWRFSLPEELDPYKGEGQQVEYGQDQKEPPPDAISQWDLRNHTLTPLQLVQVNRALIVLARTFRALREREDVPEQVLAISLDADASDLVIRHLPGAKPEPLNLGDGQGGFVRPSVPELAARLSAATPHLQELESQFRANTQRSSSVLGKAPTSILCFLGWRLRFSSFNAVYNDFDGKLRPFRLPSPRLEPRVASNGLGFFSKTDIELNTSPLGQIPADHSVLIIDMMRRVSAADVATFPGSLRPFKARILRAKDMERPLEPQDFQTVLQDLVDHIAFMRYEEGVRHFHMALVCQDVLAFGLGRQLHSQGTFHLYEWDRSAQRYLPVITFPDPDQPDGDPSEQGPSVIDRTHSP